MPTSRSWNLISSDPQLQPRDFPPLQYSYFASRNSTPIWKLRTGDLSTPKSTSILSLRDCDLNAAIATPDDTCYWAQILRWLQQLKKALAKSSAQMHFSLLYCDCDRGLYPTTARSWPIPLNIGLASLPWQLLNCQRCDCAALHLAASESDYSLLVEVASWMPTDCTLQHVHTIKSLNHFETRPKAWRNDKNELWVPCHCCKEVRKKPTLFG